MWCTFLVERLVWRDHFQILSSKWVRDLNFYGPISLLDIAFDICLIFSPIIGHLWKHDLARSVYMLHTQNVRKKELLLLFFFLIQFLEDFGKIGEIHFSKQCVKFDAGKVMLIKNTAKTFWFPKHAGDKHLLLTYPKTFFNICGVGQDYIISGQGGAV